MLRKIFKDLKPKLNLTEEQLKVFDETFNSLPKDLFKTFETEQSFNEYISKHVEPKFTSEIENLKKEVINRNIDDIIRSIASTEEQSKLLKHFASTSLDKNKVFKTEEIKKFLLEQVEQFPSVFKKDDNNDIKEEAKKDKIIEAKQEKTYSIDEVADEFAKDYLTSTPNRNPSQSTQTIKEQSKAEAINSLADELFPS